MKLVLLPTSILLLLSVTGCGMSDLATAAADAAACRALEGTINATAKAYEDGLIDSGVIAQVDSLIGEQVRGLLSTEMAKDLGELAAAVGSSEPAQTTKNKVAQLSQSISIRCAAVGVNFAK